MAQRVPINWFVSQLEAAYKRKDGYIMGSTGQYPKKAGWTAKSWWVTQYSGAQKTKALYWLEHATRVWDCNGMAEGLYKDYTGRDINTYARVNFHTWCDGHNGWGLIPESERKPGMAVFKANSKGSWSTIHHVGYLWKKVGSTWKVIEAKGVMYGVIVSDLNSSWNAWGRMDKYFDYGDNAAVSGVVTVSEYPELSYGDEGDYVKYLQKLLLKWNAECLPKWGTDGDFGSETRDAVKAFQTEAGLETDGVCGNATWTALNKLENADETLTVTGGSVNLRDSAGVEGKVIGIAHKGENLKYTDTEKVGETTWYRTSMGWISGKYVMVKE